MATDRRTAARALAAAGLLAVCCRSADDGRSHARTVAEAARSRFHALDGDRNGVLSADEYPFGRAAFAALGPEPVTVERFEERYPRQLADLQRQMAEPGGWVAVFDRDGDGKLSPEERRRIPSDAELSKVDLDGDGTITVDEAREAAQPPHRWRPLKNAAEVLAQFDRLDRDRDGRLSRSELGDRRYLIARIDCDGDGTLDRAELQAAAKLVTRGPSAFAALVASCRFERLDRDRSGTLDRSELRLVPWLLHAASRQGLRSIDRAAFAKLEASALAPVRLAVPQPDGDAGGRPPE